MVENKTTINMPSDVEEILSAMESLGHKSYIVGGCVRDSLIGRTPKDWDITTSMLPEDVMKLFKSMPGYRVLPTGLKHGTVTVMPPDAKEGYEITTFRVDGDYTDARHPDSVSFSSDIEEDLSRRDLTINAMAYSPVHGLVDPFGGSKDLRMRILRTVGAPDDRFKEDALRMMRAIRFSAQLGFSIETDTLEAIKRNASLITMVSEERRRDEITKILMSSHPGYMRAFEHFGIMSYLIPEVHEMFETSQNNSWHLYNVGEHTMKALESTPCDLEVRLAILFHDIGKPSCHTTDLEGKDHFYGHPSVSESMTRSIMARMKFPNETIDRVCKLVYIHDMRPAHTQKAVRRFVSQNELSDEMFMKYHEVVEADARGQNIQKSMAKIEDNDAVLVIYQEIKNQPMSVKDLAINGCDCMELGLKGPEIGNVLRYLLGRVLDNPELNEREILVGIIKENHLDRHVVLHTQNYETYEEEPEEGREI